jgi:hypothetical protein
MPTLRRVSCSLATALALTLSLGLASSSSVIDAPASLGSAIFPLSISGKSWQTDVILNPGVKPPIGKIDDGRIAGVLQGTLQDFAAQFLDLDASGRFFLYYDGRTSWRVATNENGQDTTLLSGQVANDGEAWMSGAYTPPGAQAPIGTIFLRGRVKFIRGTFDAASIAGEAWFVAGGNVGSGLELKWKTGAPVR